MKKASDFYFFDEKFLIMKITMRERRRSRIRKRSRGRRRRKATHCIKTPFPVYCSVLATL